jgi:ubiquinone biosynthesis protein
MPEINMWTLARPLIEEWMAQNRGLEARARYALGEAVARIEELPVFIANLEKSAAMLASGGVRLHPDAISALTGARRRVWPWVALALACVLVIVAILD